MGRRAICISKGTMMWLALLVVMCYLAVPVQAFGAGNIASISTVEGVNFRHGDIEDVLLTLTMSASLRSRKFDSMHVKRVYFGNWLRDYSQAIDVGSLKHVEKDTIRMLLWVLAFMTFGFATGEFEVTEERLGCYRPEEHIDNPKGYPNDAQDYDPRLRGPVDEEVELAIDPESGMKNYIANERIGIMTSANLLRRTLGRSIELARSYARTGIKAEKYEALRLLGTGLHCLEDFSAHSNYVELALRELGEASIFPHVGAATEGEYQGRFVFPLTTGTFGGVDLLHSVLGEVNDKAIQSEIQLLEDSIIASEQQAEQDGGEATIVRRILGMIPSGVFGGGDQEEGVSSAELSNQASNLEVRAKLKKETGDDGTGNDLNTTIYQILEFHDKISRVVNRIIESIPGLAAITEKLSEAVSIFVFALLAPYILPILDQAKAELTDASSEVIRTAEKEQHVVFYDEYSTNPTHSMLSKDHFTNHLNEPAGRVAREVVRYVVPIIMEAWDDESIDIQTTLDHIVAIFHHPALRNVGGYHQCREAMFEEVRKWWDEKSKGQRQYLRDALSRDGVQEGRNHREGHDTGSGCAGHAPITSMATRHRNGDIGAEEFFNLAMSASGNRGEIDADSAAAMGRFIGDAAGAMFGRFFSGGGGDDEEHLAYGDYEE